MKKNSNLPVFFDVFLSKSLDFGRRNYKYYLSTNTLRYCSRSLQALETWRKRREVRAWSAVIDKSCELKYLHTANISEMAALAIARMWTARVTQSNERVEGNRDWQCSNHDLNSQNYVVSITRTTLRHIYRYTQWQRSWTTDNIILNIGIDPHSKSGTIRFDLNS